jgi:hypothetical protein
VRNENVRTDFSAVKVRNYIILHKVPSESRHYAACLVWMNAKMVTIPYAIGSSAIFALRDLGIWEAEAWPPSAAVIADSADILLGKHALTG